MRNDSQLMNGKPTRRLRQSAGVFATAGLLSLTVAACSAAAAQSGGSASLGAQALQNLTSFEKGVLKDKQVTVAELIESTQVYKECLSSRHISYSQGDPGNLGPSGIQTLTLVPAKVSDPDAYEARIDNETQACLNSVSAVEDVWVLQNQASESDIDNAKTVFVSCVQKAGLRLGQDADFASAGKAARALVERTSGAETDSSSPLGIELAAVSDCLSAVTKSAQVALPGLSQALDSLDTSGW